MQLTQECQLHHLKILQQLTGPARLIQAKEPLHDAIIQAKQTARAGAPLRLKPQEHFKRLPILRPNLDHLGRGFLLWQMHAPVRCRLLQLAGVIRLQESPCDVFKVFFRPLKIDSFHA